MYEWMSFDFKKHDDMPQWHVTLNPRSSHGTTLNTPSTTCHNLLEIIYICIQIMMILVASGHLTDACGCVCVCLGLFCLGFYFSRAPPDGLITWVSFWLGIDPRWWVSPTVRHWTRPVRHGTWILQTSKEYVNCQHTWSCSFWQTHSTYLLTLISLHFAVMQ